MVGTHEGAAGIDAVVAVRLTLAHAGEEAGLGGGHPGPEGGAGAAPGAVVVVVALAALGAVVAVVAFGAAVVAVEAGAAVVTVVDGAVVSGASDGLTATDDDRLRHLGVDGRDIRRRPAAPTEVEHEEREDGQGHHEGDRERRCVGCKEAFRATSLLGDKVLAWTKCRREHPRRVGARRANSARSRPGNPGVSQHNCNFRHVVETPSPTENSTVRGGRRNPRPELDPYSRSRV